MSQFCNENELKISITFKDETLAPSCALTSLAKIWAVFHSFHSNNYQKLQIPLVFSFLSPPQFRASLTTAFHKECAVQPCVCETNHRLEGQFIIL